MAAKVDEVRRVRAHLRVFDGPPPMQREDYPRGGDFLARKVNRVAGNRPLVLRGLVTALEGVNTRTAGYEKRHKRIS